MQVPWVQVEAVMVDGLDDGWTELNCTCSKLSHSLGFNSPPICLVTFTASTSWLFADKRVRLAAEQFAASANLVAPVNSQSASCPALVNI